MDYIYKKERKKNPNLKLFETHLIDGKGEGGLEKKLRIGNPGLDEALREKIQAEASAGGTSGWRSG